MIRHLIATIAVFGLVIAGLLHGSTVSLADAPSNDNIANATSLPVGPFADSFNTGAATVEPGEPSDCFTPTHSVWYRFDSGSDFNDFQVDFTGTSFGWQTAYYTGTASALQLRYCFTSPTNGYFSAAPGEVWYIQVSGQINGGTTGGGPSNEYGDLVFHWDAHRVVPIDITVSIDQRAAVNKSGDSVVVTGRVNCSRAVSTSVSVTLTQIFAGRLVATGSGGVEVACETSPTAWSLEVLNGGPIRFGPGQGTADISAYACDAAGCGSTQDAGRVSLHRAK